MPIYEFYCESCESTFDNRTTMNARDEKVACPSCGSKETGRKLSVVAVGAGGSAADASSAHQHSGMCGCGKRPGSCGMN